jgi:transposase-like protein
MLVAEAFLKSLVKLYGKHIVYSDGETWYPEACNSLGLTHILHSAFKKSIIERVIESVKDRTDYYYSGILFYDNNMSTKCNYFSSRYTKQQRQLKPRYCFGIRIFINAYKGL